MICLRFLLINVELTIVIECRWTLKICVYRNVMVSWWEGLIHDKREASLRESIALSSIIEIANRSRKHVASRAIRTCGAFSCWSCWSQCYDLLSLFSCSPAYPLGIQTIILIIWSQTWFHGYAYYYWICTMVLSEVFESIVGYFDALLKIRDIGFSSFMFG